MVVAHVGSGRTHEGTVKVKGKAMKHEVGGPPFWKADPRAWPDIVEMMTASGRAWPECVIREDLRWMLDQIRVERMDRIPGRPSLRKRWNVSDRQVRNALRALGGGRTASGQRADRNQEKSRRLSVSSGQRADSERTASGQRASTRA